VWRQAFRRAAIVLDVPGYLSKGVVPDRLSGAKTEPRIEPRPGRGEFLRRVKALNAIVRIGHIAQRKLGDTGDLKDLAAHGEARPLAPILAQPGGRKLGAFQ